jgi:hypothetical protein
MTGQLQKVENVFLSVVEWRRTGGGVNLSQKLDELCDGDAILRAEVQSLLHHLDEAGEEETDGTAFLNPQDLHGGRATVMIRDAALEEWGGAAVGQRVGDFVIIGQLGAGGMGIVYVAEQQRPRRTVALKVIRRSIATPAMLARFEREAELLGRLSHPGIAQVYAAGIADVRTVDGATIRVPYIAMELVNGPAINQYARDVNRDQGKLLTLIAQACDAIQHAHQRGVIHRDLKPANLLVAIADADAQVKIVDFGVARTVGSDFTNESITQLTGHGHFIGTPAYMSPEQVHGRSDEIGTRCDVYALGAILFELLSGRPAIDLSDCSLPEAARRIVEKGPPELGSIDRRLGGDIETIVAKALEKDPAFRYASAADMARDLRHVLAGEPIEARRESAPHILSRRAARYRNLFAAAMVLLVCVAAMAVYSYRRAVRQESAALDSGRAKLASDQRARRLAAELISVRVQYGRYLTLGGEHYGAEDVLWNEYAGHPDQPLVREALWELYSLPGNLRTVVYPDKECRALGSFSFATGNRKGVIRLTDLVGGRNTIEIAPISDVRLLEFSRDGSRLLAAGAGGIVLLDVKDGHLVRRFQGHQGIVNCADLTGDGKWIVSTGEDRSVQLWDVSTGDAVFAFSALPAAGRCVRFNRTGTHVAATLEDGGVRLWSTAWRDGRPELHESVKLVGLDDTSGTVVGFSPIQPILASGGTDGHVILWNISTGAKITTLTEAP